ncbi:hypothetical protein GCM10009603_34920 [Nocardiopsis exhalans]
MKSRWSRATVRWTHPEQKLTAESFPWTLEKPLAVGSGYGGLVRLMGAGEWEVYWSKACGEV